MYKLLVLILSLLPAIIIGKYIYDKDKKKEPKTLLFKLFISGFLCFFMVYVIELLIKKEIPTFRLPFENLSEIQLILYSFIVVAFIREISKWLMIYFVSFNHKEFEEMYDIVVYSVFVSLGFISVDTLYTLFANDTINIFKLIVNVPINACLGILMAYYLGKAKNFIVSKNKKEANLYFLLSIIIPTLLHTIFAYLLLSDHPIIVITVLLISYPLYVIAIKKLKKMGRISFRMLFRKKIK